MKFKYTDYNGIDQVLKSDFPTEWKELSDVITAHNLHIKASDQAGKIGSIIFDPVGTNSDLKDGLIVKSWQDNPKIPVAFRFLGKDIDFEKNGLIVEVQFSNYPFLLNNILRSELFFKSKTKFGANPTKALIIITKAGGFPSSNSTLYYEQAVKQLNSLHSYGIFSVPTRLVGLFPEIDAVNDVTWTEYENARYSRTPVKEETKKYKITNGTKFSFEDPKS
ncbi:BglII/BstYI family type II restriction endonuclease [Calothrix rhizosoleniae]|uniref:BglII/BstYI family type II restriction endonuclease n=1 Tax=Calothrix rhizosoleniae TaxID=888997 RepID=UPI000B499AF8|nr:BglII/BstYI family type II restriction endonuclease [Calothrix rhizosoleniae]